MKTKVLFLFILAGIALTFSACKKDSILSTNLDVVIYQDFIVNSTDNTVFQKDTVVDATAKNSDIDKYKDRLQEVSVEKVTYLLTAFVGDADQTLTTGTLTVAEETGANPQVLTSLSNVNLQGLLNTEAQLTINQPAVDELVTLLKNSPNRFKLSAAGVVNKKPLNFIVRVRFYLKVKAKVL